MDDFDTKDTIPAMPVVSSNPYAEERKELERKARIAGVAVFEAKPSVFIGLVVNDGVAERYTPEMTEDAANDWIGIARSAAGLNAWIPTVCARCLSVMSTPSLCGVCIRGRR